VKLWIGRAVVAVLTLSAACAAADWYFSYRTTRMNVTSIAGPGENASRFRAGQSTAGQCNRHCFLYRPRRAMRQPPRRLGQINRTARPGGR